MADDDKKKDILADYFKNKADRASNTIIGKSKPMMIIIMLLILSIFVVFPFIIGMLRSGYVSFDNGGLTIYSVVMAIIILGVGWFAN